MTAPTLHALCLNPLHPGPCAIAQTAAVRTFKRDYHGRFAEKAGASMPKWLQARDNLAASVTSGIQDEQQLSGGNAAAAVYLVTTNDGSKAVWKLAQDRRTDAVHQTDAEVLSPMVAAALGIPAPATHKDTNEGAHYQEVMPGLPAVGRFTADATPDELKRIPGFGVTTVFKPREERWADTIMGARIGLLDQLIDNPDRHAGNWMIEGDQITAAIDHGQAQAWSKGLTSPDKPTWSARDVFAARYSENDYWGNTGDMKWIDNPLTPADIAKARAVLAPLRAEYAKLGREDWFDNMMGRLDALSQHAKGTVDQL